MPHHRLSYKAVSMAMKRCRLRPPPPVVPPPFEAYPPLPFASVCHYNQSVSGGHAVQSICYALDSDIEWWGSHQKTGIFPFNGPTSWLKIVVPGTPQSVSTYFFDPLSPMGVGGWWRIAGNTANYYGGFWSPPGYSQTSLYTFARYEETAQQGILTFLLMPTVGYCSYAITLDVFPPDVYGVAHYTYSGYLGTWSNILQTVIIQRPVLTIHLTLIAYDSYGNLLNADLRCGGSGLPPFPPAP